MSVNSKAAFKKYVTPQQIVSFLQSNGYDVKNYIEYNNNEVYPSGYIAVNKNDISTLLFYCVTSDNTDLFNKENIVSLIGDIEKYTVEVMKNLLKNFGGGYIDENDCDDIELEETYVHGEYDDEICQLINI